MAKTFQDVSISNMTLTTYCCSKRMLSRWPKLFSGQPYWRLYWNDRSGATISTVDNEIPMGPRKLCLVAPHTRYETVLTETPLVHFFIHFNLGDPYDSISQLIVDYPLSRLEQREWKDKVKTVETNLELTPMNRLWVFKWVATTVNRIPGDHLPTIMPDKRITRSKQLMLNQLSAKWSNDLLAKKSAMATNSFIRLFRNATGVSPMQWLLKERIKHACFILERSNASIEEIAEQCGFGDRAHFSTRFRKMIGVGPATYRKQSLE